MPLSGHGEGGKSMLQDQGSHEGCGRQRKITAAWPPCAASARRRGGAFRQPEIRLQRRRAGLGQTAGNPQANRARWDGADGETELGRIKREVQPPELAVRRRTGLAFRTGRASGREKGGKYM